MDLVLNANQICMLNHLVDATKRQPFKLESIFSMKDKKNYQDYLELVKMGLIKSNRAEWITEKGIKALESV